LDIASFFSLKMTGKKNLFFKLQWKIPKSKKTDLPNRYHPMRRFTEKARTKSSPDHRYPKKSWETFGLPVFGKKPILPDKYIPERLGFPKAAIDDREISLNWNWEDLSPACGRFGYWEDRNQGWESAEWRESRKMGIFGGLVTTVVTNNFQHHCNILKI
jgi:hypothetical protein